MNGLTPEEKRVIVDKGNAHRDNMRQMRWASRTFVYRRRIDREKYQTLCKFCFNEVYTR